MGPKWSPCPSFVLAPALFLSLSLSSSWSIAVSVLILAVLVAARLQVTEAKYQGAIGADFTKEGPKIDQNDPKQSSIDQDNPKIRSKLVLRQFCYFFGAINP